MFWDGTWRDKAAPVVAEIWNIWNIFQQHSQHAFVTVPPSSYKFEIWGAERGATKQLQL